MLPPVDSRQASQMLTAIPRNSRRLLIPLCPKMGLVFGMHSLQARPERLYPPRPKGQASDQQILSGSRVTRRFIGTPRLAWKRNPSHRRKSSRASVPNFRCLFPPTQRSRPRLILLMKCRELGMTYAVWFNLPTNVSSSFAGQ
jgi:hypothetical protein